MSRLEYQRAYYRLYRRQTAGWHALVDDTAVVEHLHACLDVGMSVAQIGVAAGLSEDTVRRHVDNPGGFKIRQSTADRILAVTPRRPVTAVGMTRRIRALNALGWSSTVIAKHAGVDVENVRRWRRGDRTNSPHRARDALLRTYDELSMRTPSTATPAQRKSVSRTVNEARRNGWVTPLAWEDDTIDDPAAQPIVTEHEHSLDLDDWLYLVRSGEHPERAAERCGVTLKGIEKAARRHDRHDVLARVYRRAVA
jgi:hypothetical protein